MTQSQSINVAEAIPLSHLGIMCAGRRTFVLRQGGTSAFSMQQMRHPALA
jgi:hypothetical protein